MELLNRRIFQVEAALLYDAVNLFKKTIMEFKHHSIEVGDINNAMDQPIPTCESQTSWKAGFSIINAMKVVRIILLIVFFFKYKIAKSAIINAQ